MCVCACVCVCVRVCVCVVLLDVRLYAANCSEHKSGHLLLVSCAVAHGIVYLVHVVGIVCILYVCHCMWCVCVLYALHRDLYCIYTVPIRTLPPVTLPQRMETCILGERQAPTWGICWRTPSSSDRGRWMPWCTDVCSLLPVATSTPLVSPRVL